MVVEEALCSRDFRSVSTLYGNVAHDGDQDVLLDVERAGVQTECLAEDPEPIGGKNELQGFAQRQSDKLANDPGDVYRRVWMIVSHGKWNRTEYKTYIER